MSGVLRFFGVVLVVIAMLYIALVVLVVVDMQARRGDLGADERLPAVLYAIVPGFVLGVLLASGVLFVGCILFVGGRMVAHMDKQERRLPDKPLRRAGRGGRVVAKPLREAPRRATFCSACGEALDWEARFCGDCGAAQPKRGA